MFLFNGLAMCARAVRSLPSVFGGLNGNKDSEISQVAGEDDTKSRQAH
jgi:hypothetical protein